MESFLTLTNMTSYFCEEVDAFASCCMTTDKPCGDKVNQIFLSLSTVLLSQHRCVLHLLHSCHKAAPRAAYEAAQMPAAFLLVPHMLRSEQDFLHTFCFQQSAQCNNSNTKKLGLHWFQCLASLKGSIILVNTLSLQILFISSLTV